MSKCLKETGPLGTFTHFLTEPVCVYLCSIFTLNDYENKNVLNSVEHSAYS